MEEIKQFKEACGIKIGDYIRTNEGHIGKLKRIELDKIDKSLKWFVFDHKEFEINIIKEEYINKPYITNSSPNIIDLIEIRDIVRIEFPPDEYCKEPVEVIWTIKGSAMLNNLKCGIKSKEVKLKTIATKEQFENIEFRLED